MERSTGMAPYAVGSQSSIFCHVGIWNSTKLHGGRSMICLLLASGEAP